MRHFYDQDRMILVQPHPGHVVATLDKMLYDYYHSLVASNSRKFTW